MWFIGVEVEEETSAPPPKKILDPPLVYLTTSMREIMTSLSFVFLTLIINIVMTNVP